MARMVVTLAVGLHAAVAGGDGAPPLPSLPAAAARLDPRLLAVARAGAAESVTVWLGFADKGERSPADLVALLAAAEQALTPRARARRLRAGVAPLVSYDDLPVAGGYLESLAARGLTVAAQSRWLNRVAVRVPGGRLIELAGLPFVHRLTPVEKARRSAVPPEGTGLPVAAAPATPAPALHAPSSPAIAYGRTLAMLQQMNVPAVHDSGYTGTGILVCIIDNGFTYHDRHEALRDVPIAPGRKRDFIQGDTVVVDTLSAGLRHGTQVMGCIAGNLPGAYVGSGFGADFALARTEADAFERPVEMLYWGMAAEWADSLGADLITSSVGYCDFETGYPDYTYADMDGRTTDVSRAAQIAASKGILVVNAVGNEGNRAWHYLIAPSDVATDSLIAVGAVDANGVVAPFSSYGPNAAGVTKPDLAARGVSDTLIFPGSNPNQYSTSQGTSFATPLVAGLAACLLQARPAWPPTWVARALRETASRASSPDNRVGWGIPDGLAALRWDPGLAGPPMDSFGMRLMGPNPLRVGGAPLRIVFGLGACSPVAARARVRVFDTQGRAVRDLYSGVPACPSTLTASWDGRTNDGVAARPGVYLVALESGSRRGGARVILLP